MVRRRRAPPYDSRALEASEGRPLFSLLLGPGGPFRRLAGEVVPLLAGLVLSSTVAAFAGWTAGAAVGLAGWLGLSFALVRVRRRPLLRRVYRLAVLAHVLVWSALGWSGSTPEPAGPPGEAATLRWERPQPFRAGAAEVLFRLPPHATLSGFGQRPRRAALPPLGGMGVLGRAGREAMASRDHEGRARAPLFHEPEPGGQRLGARALVLVPVDGGPTLAFVRLDLVTSDPWLAAEVAERTRDLGVTPPTLLLAATHTHSGVGGYAREPLSALLATDHFDPAVFDAVAAAAADALRAAHRAARPARLAFAEAHDRGADGETILATRRGPASGGPVRDGVTLLRVDGEDGATLAVLLDYAVHPVAMRREHMRFDRDVPGAVEQALSARLPGAPLVLFVQGALADVAPRFRGAPREPDAPRRAAERFAEAVAPALAAAPSFDRLRVEAARVERDLGEPRAVVGWGDRGEFLDDASLAAPFAGSAPGLAADVLALPANLLLWSTGVTEARVVGSVRGSAGLVVNLAPHVARRTHAVGGLVLSAESADGTRRARLPVLWVPGEPSQALGQAWRAAWGGDGGPAPMVVALANGSMGYAVTAAEYRGRGYEARGTLFGAGTDGLLTEALERAREALAR